MVRHARHGTFRSGTDQPCPVGSARHGAALLVGTARPVGAARHGSARLTSSPYIQPGKDYLSPARRGTARRGPPGTASFSTCPVQKGVSMGAGSLVCLRHLLRGVRCQKFHRWERRLHGWTWLEQKGVSMGTASLATSPTSSSTCSVPEGVSIGTAFPGWTCSVPPGVLMGTVSPVTAMPRA